MFGYLTVNTEALSNVESAEYKGRYCGICDRLRRVSGIKGTLCLKYDLVLLSLILSSLYEPETIRDKCRCLRHPFNGVSTVEDVYTDYAADMGIILTYLKLVDDAIDDNSAVAKLGTKLLESAYEEVKGRHSDTVLFVEEKLSEMSRLEKENSRDADRMAGLFGEITGEMFTPKKDDFWAPYLNRLGIGLGRYLYLLDACLDLADDKKNGKYNPFTGTDREDETWQREALAVCLGEIGEAYDILPIVENKELIDNIIYSGITAAVPEKLRLKTES